MVAAPPVHRGNWPTQEPQSYNRPMEAPAIRGDVRVRRVPVAAVRRAVEVRDVRAALEHRADPGRGVTGRSRTPSSATSGKSILFAAVMLAIFIPLVVLVDVRLGVTGLILFFAWAFLVRPRMRRRLLDKVAQRAALAAQSRVDSVPSDARAEPEPQPSGAARAGALRGAAGDARYPRRAIRLGGCRIRRRCGGRVRRSPDRGERRREAVPPVGRSAGWDVPAAPEVEDSLSAPRAAGTRPSASRVERLRVRQSTSRRGPASGGGRAGAGRARLRSRPDAAATAAVSEGGASGPRPRPLPPVDPAGVTSA